MKQKRLICLFIALICTMSTQPKSPPKATPDYPLTIIFDVGGVLVDTDWAASLMALGPHLVAAYIIQHRQSPRNLLHTFYEVMRTADKTANACSSMKDPYGNRLPSIMCQWLKGEKSSAEIRRQLKETIHANGHLFLSTTEQKLMLRTNALIFNPIVMVKTRKLYNEGFDLARKYKKAGHRVSILSNWAADSFDLLIKQYPTEFSVFDPIILSGAVGCAKPEPDIFMHYTRTINPSTCILIDDQIENIIAARAQGMCGIHCTYTQTLWGKKPDFNKVRKQINAYYELYKRDPEFKYSCSFL